MNKKFDIIFIDPPYNQQKLKDIIDLIISDKFLKNDGIIITHRHKKQIDTYPRDFEILEEKIYGISKILFGKLK